MYRFAVAFLVVISVSGCGGVSNPPTLAVSGVVTQSGKPVEGAAVTFVPREDKSLQAASGVTDSAGKYSLTTFVANDGAMKGEYDVKVTKFIGGRKAGADDDSKEGEGKTLADYSSAYKPNPQNIEPPPKNTLPKKYEDHNTSGLKHNVAQPGTFDIDLKG